MMNLHSKQKSWMTLIVVCFVCPTSIVVAQQPNNGDQPVTRREFDKFLKEYRQFQADYVKLKKENAQLRSELTQEKTRSGGPLSNDRPVEFKALASHEREAILEVVREEIRDATESLLPGKTNFVIGGAAVVTFQDRENVNSTFGIGIAPTLLWKPTDRLLLEAEIAFGLTGDETFVELDYAQFSYLYNDYVTLSAGKFLTPFGTFWERWHPSWINRAATMPLIYERGLVGPTGLGVQARGGFAFGTGKANYAVYYVNGPDFEDTSLTSAGHLGFENFRDNNNNKTFGGRVGYLPVPDMEFGYSFQTGEVGDSGSPFSGVDTFIQGVDFSFAREFASIQGRLDLRAEAIWVDTDNVVFTGPFKPFTFNNKRNGWFVQASFRPTLSDVILGSDIELKNVEFVMRYDQLRESGPGALGADHDRITLGLDYWISPKIVIKTAYSHDDVHGGKDEDGFFMQFAVGF